MAGEIVKSEALCLSIRPWSRTSHVVWWLTPHGRVTTLVKGAVRPKSAFLGQYDLNYRCEILYYARAKGEIHALREVTPLDRRDALRGDYRALTLADYMRRIVTELVPEGPDAADWYALLDKSLGNVESLGMAPQLPWVHFSEMHRWCEHSVPRGEVAVKEMLAFELKALELAGLSPDLSNSDGEFRLRGERQMQLAPEVLACLKKPRAEWERSVLLEAAKALGVFFAFHLDCARDVRRSVLKVIS